MANKYKRINQQQQKKAQDDSNLRMVMGLVIVAVVAVAVFLAYGTNKGQQQQPSAAGANGQSTQQTQDLAQVQQRVTQSEKAVQANPNDYNSLLELGNAYYDLGSAYLTNGNQTDGAPNFAKAVDPYQKALAQKFDINVQTDMATAAFYGGKNDIADAAFKTAIEKQPDFLTARYNYGVFLSQVKNDKEGAKKQLEYVANQTKDKNAADKAKQFLQTIK